VWLSDSPEFAEIENYIPEAAKVSRRMKLATRDLRHQTFYGCNLQMFEIS
jgi:hypothetical protein